MTSGVAVHVIDAFGVKPRDRSGLEYEKSRTLGDPLTRPDVMAARLTFLIDEQSCSIFLDGSWPLASLGGVRKRVLDATQ